MECGQVMVMHIIPFYIQYDTYSSNHQNENSKFQNEKNVIDL